MCDTIILVVFSWSLDTKLRSPKCDFSETYVCRLFKEVTTVLRFIVKYVMGNIVKYSR